jgi:DNA-directed RNA polymerase subunit RPC12/RpoP
MSLQIFYVRLFLQHTTAYILLQDFILFQSNSKNSLECTCEKINLNSSNKKISVCEICSEKFFMKSKSTELSYEEDTLSESYNNSK